CDGYAVVTGVLDADQVAATRAELEAVLETIPHGRNPFEGFHTRRIYALFAKTRLLDGPATHPLVLGVLDQVLSNYQLSAPNRTDRPRVGVVLEYVASWLRPQENHFLAVPRDVVAQLPARLQELLGYNVYPPFVGYVDGRHPRKLLGTDEN